MEYIYLNDTMEAFIRIQKSGSTSLENSLKYCKNINFLSHGYCYKIDNKNTGWSGTNEFPLINRKRFSKLYALVRNPFEILVSYYHHTHKNSINNIDGWCRCNKVHGFKSWEEFLNSYIDEQFQWHLPPMKKSMYSFAYDENDNLIIDKFFKLENLDELNKFLLSKGAKKMIKSNITMNKPTSFKFYTKYHVSKLESIWEKDLDYFNYSYNGI